MPTLNLMVALAAEARPLIDRYRLRAVASSPFRCYRSKTKSPLDLRLVVTGIGKVAMASAVGWTAQHDLQAGWINVGIAGHGRAQRGDVLLAHTVRDRATGRRWYPPLIITPPCGCTEVITVDTLETSYGDANTGEAADVGFDMEASAFVESARRFASAELVHCLKVVSDGPNDPIEALDKDDVSQLVTSALPAIEKLVEELDPLVAETAEAAAEPPDMNALLEAGHFTVSDQRQLRHHLLRRAAIAPGEALPSDLWSAGRRGRHVVERLARWLDDKVEGGVGLGSAP